MPPVENEAEFLGESEAALLEQYREMAPFMFTCGDRLLDDLMAIDAETAKAIRAVLPLALMRPQSPLKLAQRYYITRIIRGVDDLHRLTQGWRDLLKVTSDVPASEPGFASQSDSGHP